MSEVETFVEIEGFENYEVSNLGKVRNIKSGRMLKHNIEITRQGDVFIVERGENERI